jgi:hypothetical protein
LQNNNRFVVSPQGHPTAIIIHVYMCIVKWNFKTIWNFMESYKDYGVYGIFRLHYPWPAPAKTDIDQRAVHAL